MRFVCEDCSFEMDYDEDIGEIIVCDECGGDMYADEGSNHRADDKSIVLPRTKRESMTRVADETEFKR